MKTRILIALSAIALLAAGAVAGAAEPLTPRAYLGEFRADRSPSIEQPTPRSSRPTPTPTITPLPVVTETP